MSFFENMCKMTGYEPKTTFWQDFAIAEADAIKGVRETYERIMREWSDNYIYLTELVMVLNWNIWYWHEGESCYAKDLTEMYHRFRELQQFCYQYESWKSLYEKSDGWDGRGDVTSRDGIRRADLIRNITTIEECANSIDRNLLRFVTVEGSSLPPELWYQQRIFFWKLSQMRG